ncbi:MAG TPA: glycoside hydrolase family 3 N-terminal domain-containing protein [Sphingobium sp.]|uniref:glycoside hydrolase family 3 N-terminal domain-containing protein n=1 Tax=Sphingobium sp. TaxID=1912891 RepID=UPI002ED1F3BE
MKWLYLGLPVLALSSQLIAQPAPPPPYKQADAPIPARVQDLLARMTIEEKVAQLQSNSTLPPVPGLAVGPNPAFGIIRKGEVDPAVAQRALGNGIGAFNIVSFDPHGMSAAEQVAQANAIQGWVVRNTRLGIPVLFQGEALHGALVGGATAFPQAVALGSTWDRSLIRQMFTVVGKESRAAGISMVLAPVFDLARDPRFGRVEEMYSEDPYLVGELGVEAVRGLQGQDMAIDQAHVIATAKHFVHGQPENGTNTAPNDVSERTMREVFFPPFEKAVKVAHIGAVMPSYNENEGGIPSHVNRWLLKDVLRKEWGFTGITSSDWFAVSELFTRHHIAASEADAGTQAFNAGLDMETPNAPGFAGLADAVRAGKVSQQDLDAAVGRVLTLKFRAGLFEQPLTDASRVAKVLGDPAHAALARKVADEAIILLKNEDKLLPLDPAKIQSIAVIGPNADKERLGGYSGKPASFVTVLQGIRSRVGGKVAVSYAEGVRISEPDKDAASNKLAPYQAPSPEKDAALIAEAVETARKAQVVLLVLGGNETVTREAFPGFGGAKAALGDTDDLELPGRQNDLVREIMKLGKPTVAILLNGRAYSAVQLSRAVPAIVEGWYLGQETGNALAGVVFGDVNPSGKLPVTIARGVGQLPVYYYRKPLARLGYVFNDNSPLYPFGYGLSYTSFTYGKPVIDRTRITQSGSAKVTVDVTNSGARAGDEIVQMYVHPKVSSVVQPVLRLAGFERISLKPRQTRTVSFTIGQEQLAIWDREMKRSVEPGAVDIFVGPDVQHLEQVTLEVTP